MTKFNENIISFLINAKAKEVEHFQGRNLFDHLCGTAKLIKEWGGQEYMINAALCHSIYGTFTFDKELVSYSNREKIQDLIGNMAENLVYIFCCADKRHFYNQMEQNLDLIEIKNQFLNNYFVIPRAKALEILEISFANSIDHLAHIEKPTVEHIIKIVHLWTKFMICLSEPAKNYFLKFFNLNAPSSQIKIRGQK